MNLEGKMEKIKLKYPSICYNCENARKPASGELTKQGYVGCTLNAKGMGHGAITEAEVIAEGWVDLKSKIKLGRGSGVLTNLQLITKCVTDCREYSPIYNSNEGLNEEI